MLNFVNNEKFAAVHPGASFLIGEEHYDMYDFYLLDQLHCDVMNVLLRSEFLITFNLSE